jgi:hypothetical protein
MRQLEIEFFWPLTEQMPLDLDYTNCHQEKLYTTIPTYSSYSMLTTNGNSPQWSTSLVASNMTIDVGTTVFKVEEQPPLYRRVLYKLMNIKWEKK